MRNVNFLTLHALSGSPDHMENAPKLLPLRGAFETSCQILPSATLKSLKIDIFHEISVGRFNCHYNGNTYRFPVEGDYTLALLKSLDIKSTAILNSLRWQSSAIFGKKASGIYYWCE
ncbi:hypothetical protein PPYR_06662 [Photinus pyralis]|uniref:Uncharacterized protein n=1 Tax=Photinus pyralis TaxID=7054 RepID=A0A5N4AN57_PHOPY|nr:hypothetical protein PPYR_06662 [Photinus pyralis]